MTADSPEPASPGPASPGPASPGSPSTAEAAGQGSIAVDAMGGDRGVASVVEGALLACAAGHGPLTLVGDPAQIAAALAAAGARDVPIDVAAASEVIGMAEHPGRAARVKRDSSMHVGFRRVKEGQAVGFVSAGNTGAMMTVGLLTLRRLSGCDRPAIATALPTAKAPVILLDVGANAECRASHLAQFALMGAAYAEIKLGKARPTVALLSNGVEPTKGTESLREAHRLLTSTDLRYVGFIEGRDLLLGDVDVVVTDGFVGNVVLKLTEGISLALLERVRETLKGDWLGTLGAMLMRRALRKLRGELDWRQVGGAPLLGLEGLAVVAHGGSGAEAIAAAIATCRAHALRDLTARLRVGLGELGLSDDSTSTSELPIARTSGGFERGDLEP